MTKPPNISWLEALAIYRQRPVMGMVLLGFSAGLPYLLVFSTLTAWLTESGVSRSAIGFFAWVGMTYSIKVLWAPVIDRLSIPLFTHSLGQLRGWMLVGQLGIAIGLLLMTGINPAKDLMWMAVLSVWIAFFSSTQDIAIDAFRIESAIDDYQGAMSAAYILGYRLALLAAGAGALLLAEQYSWVASYQVMASLMLVGVFAVLWLPEPAPHHKDKSTAARGIQQWFLTAVVAPFVEFFKRNGRFALVLLLFISVFRLSDIAMGIMANPFYLDMGFSKSEIASVAKFFGFFMTIAGSAFCGLLVVKWGLYQPMLLGAVLVATTNLLFALLASIGQADVLWLTLVISADNLSGGIATTAFIAYLSSLTNRSYTATQYALFSSLMTLPGKFISGFSGVVVDGFGYSNFFIVAAAMGLPAIILVWVIMRREPETNA